jgi:pimeloyl-ACP methyl ester carboxylesterase
MLTRLLAVLMLVQALALGALWLWGRFGPGSALLGLVGLYAGIAAGMFAISELWRGPRPADLRIGPLRAARLFVAETAALMALYLVFHPFERWLAPRNPPKGAAGPPVLFIHGYLCNGGFWWWLRRRLARDGIANTHVITCGPVFGSIDRFAEQVAARVAEIRAAQGSAPVVLVGHSMGGLIARRHVQLHGAGGVARIISLGTPHHGTIHAQLANSRNGKQMRPGSDWLAALNADEAAPAPVPVCSVYSHHDNIVAPQDSARLAHAENLPLAGLGHLEMAFSPRILRVLREQLAS